MSKQKIIRATTVPMSISAFVLPLIPELAKKYDVMLLSSEGKEWNEIETVAKNIKNKGENINCIKINMERHISPLKDLKSLWQLLCTFKKEKPDMVHSMTPKAGLLCMLAGKLTGVPVRVHTFTGLVFPTSTGLKRKILMFTDRLTCACATHIIPEGEGVKNDLLNYGITRKPIKVLGYGNCKGIDLEYFDPSKVDAGEWKDENKVTFIAIGRLVGDKGINELVTLGVVTEPEVFEAAMDRVEERASDILGYDYTLDNTVTYDFALTEKDKLSNVGLLPVYSRQLSIIYIL